MKSLPVLLLLSLGAVAGSAAASDDRPDDGYRSDGYRSDGYRNDEGRGEDYAQVVDAEPIYQRYSVSEPREECHRDMRYDSRTVEQPAGGHMVLGGLIGAVLGHQFGYGRERAGATIAGAVIGSAIGHDAAQRGNDYARDSGYRRSGVERCVTRYDEHEERRIQAWRVTYRYNGRLYTRELPYDPGERLPVRISVEPRPRAR